MLLTELRDQAAQLRAQLQAVRAKIRSVRAQMRDEAHAYDHHCVRCGHDWQSRNCAPACCASCKIKYWDRPARVPGVRPVGPAGPCRRIPALAELEVNCELVIPWPGDNPNNPDFGRAIRSINASIYRYAAGTGKKFYRQGSPAGLLVRRIK